MSNNLSVSIYYPDAPNAHQPYWIYLIATVLCLQGILIITANSFVIGFYQRKYHKTVPLIYIVIAICDSVTGLTSICHAGIFAGARYPMAAILSGYPSFVLADLFLRLLFIVVQAMTRSSLFYNTVLSVIRTINITRPFYQLKKKTVILCLISYPILWFVAIAIDVCLAGNMYVETVFVNYPGFGTTRALQRLRHYRLPDVSKKVMYFGVITVFMAIPYALPAIIQLVCAFLQIFSILKPTVSSPSIVKERYMTVTIILLTIICLVCNVPYTAACFYYTIHWATTGEYFETKHPLLFLQLSYTLNTLLPFINALLNPMTLIVRGAALRGFVRESMIGLLNRMSDIGERFIRLVGGAIGAIGRPVSRWTDADEAELEVIGNANAEVV